MPNATPISQKNSLAESSRRSKLDSDRVRRLSFWAQKHIVLRNELHSKLHLPRSSGRRAGRPLRLSGDGAPAFRLSVVLHASIYRCTAPPSSLRHSDNMGIDRSSLIREQSAASHVDVDLDAAFLCRNSKFLANLEILPGTRRHADDSPSSF